MKLGATILAVVAAIVVTDAAKLWRTRSAPEAAAEDANATVEEAKEQSGNETAAPAREIPPEELFMPACEKHVETLVVRLHASYTYAQIPSVLAHWCMEQNYSHRFENDTVCNKYAKLLEDAHVENVDSGNKTGFTDICKKYYDEEMVAKADAGTWLWAKGEDELPSFEDTAKVEKNETEALAECSNKMKTIMMRLHNAYTYNQLPMMLMNACQGHKKWSSMKHKVYCKKLVHRLIGAHEQEVSGKLDGEAYGLFCKDYKLVDKADKPLESAEKFGITELMALSFLQRNEDEVAPSVASMRKEAQTRRLRADGKQAPAAEKENSVVVTDADELLYFLAHPEAEAHGESDTEADVANATNASEAFNASGNLTIVPGTSDLPPLDEFLPACLRHTKKLMKDLPNAYTHAQVPTVLKHACMEDEDIHGFNDAATCEDFAQRLVKAHNSENREEGYKQFCTEYYVHKGGAIVEEVVVEEKEEVVKEKGPTNYSLWGIVAILTIITVFTVVGTIMNLRKR